MKAIEKLHLLRSGKLTVTQNVKNFLEKIKNENPRINAFIDVRPELSLKQAEFLDKNREKMKNKKLFGLCIAVKASIHVKNYNISCASNTLRNYIAPYDATVIKKIRDEGGVIIGITNCDEFCCGGSGETSAFGACQNPSAFGLIPGGSSSGSAASVAAGFCDISLGSDTGGSIRNPASHCGVVGVKPSYGLVSRYGLIDLGMSLDQIGPLGKSVEDCALVLDIIKGRDENDSTSYESENIKLKNEKQITIGILKSVSEPKIQKLIDDKINLMCKKYGWKTKLIDIKYIDLAIQTYYPIVYVEFFSGTRKFDGRRFGKIIENSCGPEVLRRILGGGEISRAEYEGRYYKKALEVKQLVKNEFAKAFKQVDCIIIPTVPRLPHKLGSQISTKEMYSYDALTIPANLAEICSISIPAGKIDSGGSLNPTTNSPTTHPNEGVPVGMQIMCAPLQESKMLSIAKMVESLG